MRAPLGAKTVEHDLWFIPMASLGASTELTRVCGKLVTDPVLPDMCINNYGYHCQDRRCSATRLPALNDALLGVVSDQTTDLKLVKLRDVL